MIKLYIIRHAESEANRDRIMASRLPFPLTEAGRTDSRKIASELKKIVSIDRIISSPLVRARQTAEAFSSMYNLEVENDYRISEQELGIYSGMTYDEVKGYKQYETDSLNRWNWQPDGGGESYSDIADRVISFFNSINIESNKNILIVTHAVTFRLIRAVLEKTLPQYPKSFPNNGEIWSIEYRGLDNIHNIESIFLGDSIHFVHNP